MRAEPPTVAARLVLTNDPLDVRKALKQLSQTFLMAELTPPNRSTVEIVFAEVLNNIVEHAYANCSGTIEIDIEMAENALFCRFVDSGQPMADMSLPEGALPFIDTADPPEGGFGWHLIRTLSHDLAYRREGAKNVLTLRLNNDL